eukprot:gene13893-biopygen5728
MALAASMALAAKLAASMALAAWRQSGGIDNLGRSDQPGVHSRQRSRIVGTGGAARGAAGAGPPPGGRAVHTAEDAQACEFGRRVGLAGAREANISPGALRSSKMEFPTFLQRTQLLTRRKATHFWKTKESHYASQK